MYLTNFQILYLRNAFEGACEKEENWQSDCDAQLSWMLGISFFTVFFEFLTDTTVPIAILRYRKNEKLS